MNLYNLSRYFLKLSALEFGEGTEWIPEKFKQREEFKNFPYKNAIKVFKKFGLNDFKTPIELNQNIIEEKKYLYNLILEIKQNIESMLIFLIETLNLSYNNKIEEIKTKAISFYDYLSDANSTKLTNDLINKNNEKFFQKETSIFKIYNYFKLELNKIGYNSPNLNQLQSFKYYSNAQKPTKNLELVFSAKTSDICGMGSRGIISCQNLFGEADADLSSRLVGAILSKYLGICYITNGSNWKERGEKMFYRSLVRLLINFETNKPVIVVDELYPTKNDDITKIIIEELQKRSKLPVLNIYDINLDEYSVKQEPLIPESVEDYKDNPIEKKYNLKKEIKLLTGPDPGRRLKAVTNILITDSKFVSKNIDFISELPYPIIKNFILKSNLNSIINLYDYMDPAIRTLIAQKIKFNEYPNEFKKMMNDTDSNVIAKLLNKHIQLVIPISIFEYFATLPEKQQQFIIDSINEDVGNQFVEYMEGIGKS